MSDLNEIGKRVVVVKVGGSVLTGTKAFRRVALYLKNRSEQTPNEKLVVVVSAQRRATDTLERRARRIVRSPNVRSLDLLWSTGELHSVALLALHLEQIRVSAVGLNVHETGLGFDSEVHACPLQLRLSVVRVAIWEHAVVVVPGFLATRSGGAIVSLGRGGSDLSAVLLAVGLRANRCELIKDVPGYFEQDPHENESANHLASLSFDEAIRMADTGCELVQGRALAAACEANLPLVIRSMDDRAPFTVISGGPQFGRTDLRDETVAAEA